jgi:hypothetical protein
VGERGVKNERETHVSDRIFRYFVA